MKFWKRTRIFFFNPWRTISQLFKGCTEFEINNLPAVRFCSVVFSLQFVEAWLLQSRLDHNRHHTLNLIGSVAVRTCLQMLYTACPVCGDKLPDA